MRAKVISDLPQIKNIASADSWLQQANAADAWARLSARKSGRAITCIAVNSWRWLLPGMNGRERPYHSLNGR